ncbi:MAG: hypothetical protein IKN05_08660, partial [Clostridia bacterium]|nr:hypothetical protein [Clostridia bacterium]
DDEDDDDVEDDDDDEDDGDDDDADDEDLDTDDGDDYDDDVGKLIVDEIDYGAVLFNDTGVIQDFTTFDEEIEPGNRVLTVIPLPLKDAETGEELYLSDGIREQYGEQHLRLSASLVQTLLDRDFTEIIYELEQADLHIPMTSLVSEIVLPTRSEGEGGTGLTLEDGIEAVDDEEELDIAPETLQVAFYDVCVQQIDDAELTDREQALLEGNPLMAPPYRVRIRAVLVGQEDEYASIKPDEALPVQAQPEGDADEEAPSKPVGVKLPEGCYPEGAEMLVLPTEDVRDVGEGAETVFISLIDEPEDEDVSQCTPAEFIEKEEILYARIPLNADGVYAVSAPEDSLVIGEYDDEDDFEEADAE